MTLYAKVQCPIQMYTHYTFYWSSTTENFMCLSRKRCSNWHKKIVYVSVECKINAADFSYISQKSRIFHVQCGLQQFKWKYSFSVTSVISAKQILILLEKNQFANKVINNYKRFCREITKSLLFLASQKFKGCTLKILHIVLFYLLEGFESLPQNQIFKFLHLCNL